ncbi:MAG: hypothetical protein OQK51_23115 [Kangiellaceae bacterium]|nr:hypothetical protein [Kangiellaceae bacterium]
MKKILVVLVLSIASFGANAGEQTGKIKYFDVRVTDNLHYLELEGERGDKPACARGNYWMIKDENSAAGKSQVSIVLAALMAGKSITIYGNGTCERWGDGEDIRMIRIK